MPFSRTNPSPEYLLLLEWSKTFHRTKKTFTGRRVIQSYTVIRRLIQEHHAKTLLDYGWGRASST